MGKWKPWFCRYYALYESLVLENLHHLRPFHQALEVEMSVKPLSLNLACQMASTIIGEDIQSLERTADKRLLFEIFFVIFLFNHPETRELITRKQILDERRFLEMYPEFLVFKGRTEDEMTNLIFFRNVMAVILEVIPADNNKARLMDIVTRFVDKCNFVKYALGGKPAAATKRRVLIYEREGNITPKKISRKRPHDDLTEEEETAPESPFEHQESADAITTTQDNRESHEFSYELPDSFESLSDMDSLDPCLSETDDLFDQCYGILGEIVGSHSLSPFEQLESADAIATTQDNRGSYEIGSDLRDGFQSLSIMDPQDRLSETDYSVDKCCGIFSKEIRDGFGLDFTFSDEFNDTDPTAG